LRLLTRRLCNPQAGEVFTHRLDLRSKRGGVQVKVISGPEGLKVSPEGQVTWAIPANFLEPEATVLLSIRDASGQEIAQQLRLAILEE
jgi:hypothetical protein